MIQTGLCGHFRGTQTCVWIQTLLFTNFSLWEVCLIFLRLNFPISTIEKVMPVVKRVSKRVKSLLSNRWWMNTCEKFYLTYINKWTREMFQSVQRRIQTTDSCMDPKSRNAFLNGRNGLAFGQRKRGAKLVCMSTVKNPRVFSIFYNVYIAANWAPGLKWENQNTLLQIVHTFFFFRRHPVIFLAYFKFPYSCSHIYMYRIGKR